MKFDTYLPKQSIIDQMTDIVPKGIINHHTAGSKTSTPEDLNHWFVHGRANEKYLHCGYHALIYTDGKIVQMRPWNKNGGHCPGYNTTHIGISFVGNYDDEEPTTEMWTAYSNLVVFLQSEYPTIVDITNHRDANLKIGAKATLCPGKYLYELLKKPLTPIEEKVTEVLPTRELSEYTTIELLGELTRRYEPRK